MGIERKKLKTNGTYLSRAINPEVVDKFSANFTALTDDWAYDATTVDQLNDFNHLCSLILDSVAPVQIKTKPLANQVPWINEDIHVLKRRCRKAE